MSTSVRPRAFVPKLEQRRLLEYLHDHPGARSIVQLCAAAGIPRATYYRWCRDPGFCQWLAAGWGSRLLLDGMVLINIARAQAGGKFGYWKALFDLTFDPRGLGAMQRWQQAAVQTRPDAFVPPPEPVPPPPLSLQSVASGNETDPALFQMTLPQLTARILTRTKESLARLEHLAPPPKSTPPVLTKS